MWKLFLPQSMKWGIKMKSIKEELQDIIVEKRIYPVFQPIVSLKDGHILGYEGLSRIDGKSSIKSPEELFKLAQLYDKTWQLEQVCRRKILKKIYEKQEKVYDKKLFINVNPFVINDEKFKEGFTQKYLKRYQVTPQQIVFEIVERSAIDDMRRFKEVIEHYKKQAYQIAIDDAGACYSGLNLICDIKPRYLKLDMELIRDIDKDIIKYAMVKSLVEFATVSNIYLIAEGIETVDELKTLIELGVPYGQGYFLRKPSVELEKVKESALTVIHEINAKITESRYVNSGHSLILFQLKSGKAIRAYGEKYGYDKVEEMFNLLEKTLKKQLDKEEFTVVMDESSILAVVKKSRTDFLPTIVNQDFQKEIVSFYTEKEIKNQVMKYETKKGIEKYPLISIKTEEIIV